MPVLPRCSPVQAGVTAEQMENPETAEFIYDFLTKEKSNPAPAPSRAVPQQAPPQKPPPQAPPQAVSMPRVGRFLLAALGGSSEPGEPCCARADGFLCSSIGALQVCFAVYRNARRHLTESPVLRATPGTSATHAGLQRQARAAAAAAA